MWCEGTPIKPEGITFEAECAPFKPEDMPFAAEDSPFSRLASLPGLKAGVSISGMSFFVVALEILLINDLACSGAVVHSSCLLGEQAFYFLT